MKNKTISQLNKHQFIIIKKREENKKVYYPQYCFDCHCGFISKERFSRCWNCNSKNTINCYGEKYEQHV